MRQEQVLIPEQCLAGNTGELLRQACLQAQVQLITWDIERQEPPTIDGEAASLFVAALPAGERNIPPNIASMLTATFPAMPLLLVCEEPLVRSFLALQGGRVTLLGHPQSSRKIAARIRSILSSWMRESDAEEQTDNFLVDSTELRKSGVARKEHWGEGYWAATLCRDASNTGAAAHLVQLHRDHDGREGLHAKLNRGPGQVGAEVALTSNASQWTLDVHSGDVSYWLLSPQRLPSAWEVEQRPVSLGAPGGTSQELNAKSGDIVVMLSHAARNVLDNAMLEASDGEGGQALLQSLQNTLVRSDEAFGAVLVEVL